MQHEYRGVRKNDRLVEAPRVSRFALFCFNASLLDPRDRKSSTISSSSSSSLGSHRTVTVLLDRIHGGIVAQRAMLQVYGWKRRWSNGAGAPCSTQRAVLEALFGVVGLNDDVRTRLVLVVRR